MAEKIRRLRPKARRMRGISIQPIDQVAVGNPQLDLEAVEHRQLGLGEGMLREPRGVGWDLLSC